MEDEGEFTRKRKNSFDATVCNHQHYTPQLLSFDFEDLPPKKKVEHPVIEEENGDVPKTNADVVISFNSSADETTYNESNSPVSFLRSPESVDSNCTIPLECENGSPSSHHRKVEEFVRNDESVTKCFEKNSLTVSEEAIALSQNNELSEPPGNFTFINLGFAPASLSRGSISSDEGVFMEKTPLPCVKNGESSDSTSKTERNSLDRDTFSPPPPVLSLNDDYINESGLLLPSVVGSNKSERVVLDLPGKFCSTVFTDHDYAILPKESSTDCMSCLPVNTSQVSCSENSSLLQSVAIREKEEYIPLDVGADELDKKELELRKAASGIKEILAPISVETKRLSDERELLKSKMTELHADISVRKEVIDSLKQSLSNNQERIERLVEERNRQNALTRDLNVKLVKTELKLRELQVTICQEKLKVVRGDTNDVDSIRSSIAESEERIVAINADISEFYKEEKSAEKALVLLEDQLKKYMEEDHSLRLRIDELILHQRKAEALLSENEKSLAELTSKQKQLIKERKHYSICFVNLERMMIKIKMCRKLKELDCKEEALKDKEITTQKRMRPECVSATSNVQYSRQVSVFGRNSLHEQPTASGGTSVQHYTSLQSIAIHNGSWLPQPFIPLHQHFPPGFLHVNSMVPPWSESQIHQNP